jgi:tRNA 2-thiouridine synthesizing protein A
MTKEALERLKEGILTVIVDDPSSCENIVRFVRSHGCSIRTEKIGEDFYLHVEKGEREKEEKPQEKEKKVVVYLSSHLLGNGDEALGRFLMKAFLKTLLDMEAKPDRLVLINSGVQLASEGSEALEHLKGLSEKGTEILACGTCLDFYKLKEKMGVGRISNMLEIMESLLEADQVLRP